MKRTFDARKVEIFPPKEHIANMKTWRLLDDVWGLF